MINTAIAGATGLVGRALVKKLISGDRFDKVYHFGRSEIETESSRVVNVKTDFDRIESADINEDIQVAFCSLGTTMKKAGSKAAFRKVDYEFVVNFCRKMNRCGVQRMVVVSSMGADPASRNFYLKTKGEMEQSVREIGFNKLIILRPSLLYGDRKEKRFGEQVALPVLKMISPLLFGKLRNMIPVHANQVAGAAVQCVMSEDNGVHIIQSVQMQNFLK